MKDKVVKKLKGAVKTHFATGILIFVPLALTFFAINWLDKLIIDLVALLPEEYNPLKLLDPKIPGLGIVLSVLVIYVVGFLGSVYFGRLFIKLYERILETIPGVRWLYAVAKQILEAVFKTLEEFQGSAAERFRGVVLVEYPRKGIYTLAFVTGEAGEEISEAVGRMINIFVPTTPNPTSGFFLMVPEEELIKVDLGVDEAFKLIISAGMVTPDREKKDREKKKARPG